LAKIIFAVLALLIILPSIVAALGNVNVSIGDSEIHGNVGEIRTTNVTVTNNENATDIFALTVFPQYWFGVTATLDKYVVTLQPSGSETLTLSFSIPACVDKQNQEFTITARSLANVVNATTSTVLRVEGPVCISAVIVDNPIIKPGDTSTISTLISNVAASSFSQYRLQTDIKNEAKTLKTFDQIINYLAPNSQAQINFTFIPDQFTLPDNYTVTSTLFNNAGSPISINSKNIIEVVPTFNAPVITKSNNFGLLFSTVTLSVKNENNVPLQNFLVVETVPGFAKSLASPITKTTQTTDLSDKVVYMWEISNLQPGEERVLQYQFNLQNIILVVVVLVGIILVAFNFVFSPQILKHYKVGKSVTGEREIIISIDVRNRSRHERCDCQRFCPINAECGREI
jgi:hypothetical protein